MLIRLWQDANRSVTLACKNLLERPLAPPPFSNSRSNLVKRTVALRTSALSCPEISSEAQFEWQDTLFKTEAYLVTIVASCIVIVLSISFVFKHAALSWNLSCYLSSKSSRVSISSLFEPSDKGDDHVGNLQEATRSAQIQSIPPSHSETVSTTSKGVTNISGLRRRARRTKIKPDIAQLQEAVANNDIDAVRTLCVSGVDMGYTDDFEEPPLHIAVKELNEEMVRLLINFGAHTESRNRSEETALITAVRRLDAAFRVIKILIDAGANPNARDNYGGTALHWVGAPGRQFDAERSDQKQEKERKQITLLLLEAGAELEARDYEGQTAVHRAASQGSTELVALLLAQGSSIESRTLLGRVENTTW